MNLIEKLMQIERIDSLIRRNSTGSPNDLSSKLGISERQIYNVINTMKIMGAPIYFDSYKNSYCYKEEVEFTFGFVNRNEMVAVNGGQGDLSMIEHLQLILELNKKIC